MPDDTRHTSIAPNFSYVTGFFAAAGALCFVLFSACYNIFYRRFGISPPDVDLDYSDILTHSWGFTAWIGVGFLALVFLLPALRSIWAKATHQEDVKFKLLPHSCHALLLLIILFVAGFIGINMSTKAADQAEAGLAVRPLRDPLGLMLLDVRAQPVSEIVSVTEAKTRIPTPGLTYLGNSDRSFVLYCIRDQKILKISMERFVLRTSPFNEKASKDGKTCGPAVVDRSEPPRARQGRGGK